jgi:hypothetical protein
MIIGNHSAGKSSFINWYIAESVQTTGVAIETRGFTYVTVGMGHNRHHLATTLLLSLAHTRSADLSFHFSHDVSRCGMV